MVECLKFAVLGELFAQNAFGTKLRRILMRHNAHVRVVGILLGLFVGFGICAQGTMVDFEEFTLGTTLTNTSGPLVSSSGINIEHGEFYTSSVAITSGTGTVHDETYWGSVAGSGNRMFMGNITAHFLFDGPVDEITLDYGAYGGDLNLNINIGKGGWIGGPYFTDLDGTTLNGALISVTGVAVPAGMEGTITITGVIDSFSIGGQELVIDNVSFVPEPTSLILLLTAGPVLLRSRRKTR